MILKGSTSGNGGLCSPCKGGEVHAQIVKSDVEGDDVLYTALVDSYVKSGRVELFEDAEDVFEKTVEKDVVVYNAMIEGYTFEIGQQVQGQLMKTGFFRDIKMGSALVDMYSKCGRTEDARRIFDYMPTRNVFSWTSMIDGYGKNGRPEESLALFDRYDSCYPVPNYVTFLGALSACAHAGLVAKGREIFESRDIETNGSQEWSIMLVWLIS
ncbi:Pentatricopeptide repeat-containing protein, mitochondrial [Sesamum angolense]|uniref:Pentatricopeptide repeat-containing protein, mitochondrial n=1 Tax=Sesamum angolense TaxID=2727404 RepID=A0AAE2BVH9_9LAMI|nr:Pentatricopeptide repeat-containing protein, mitochondrial [Sesamum angolense]